MPWPFSWNLRRVPLIEDLSDHLRRDIGLQPARVGYGTAVCAVATDQVLFSDIRSCEPVRRIDPGNDRDRNTYRQRWKPETLMSVMKRAYGDAPTARTEPTRYCQALLRDLACNLQRILRLR